MYYGEMMGAQVGVAQLAGAVGDLVLAPVADEIELALRLRDRLEAKISAALQRFDAGQGWAADGSLDLTSWLAAHGRLSRRDAHREAKVAQRLAQLPVTATAWATGALSSGQVAAVVANVPSERAPLYAQHEEAMTPVLAELSVADTAAVMRSWRLRAEAADDKPEPAERPSELYLSRTLDGRREVSGHLGAEDAAVVEQAMAVAQRAGVPNDAEGPAPSAAERRAASLVEVCRWFLSRHGEAASGTRNRPQVSVIVSAEDLVGDGPGRLADGTAVPASTVSRLACDSLLHRIVTAGSAVLDYGTGVRSISPALWAALVVRDGHCRHPGCDRRPSWCEGHHIQHFSKGGPTCLANLVLACTRHHHLWHGQGWALELSADATLTLISPYGVVLTSRPPPAHMVA
jgi:Domain of unknown function (DUF222)